MTVNKTAKEMFEELGYYVETEKFALFYKRKNHPLTIIFYLKEKYVRIAEEHYIGELGLYEYLAIDNPITIELHKAIHRQMEEIGWL